MINWNVIKCLSIMLVLMGSGQTLIGAETNQSSDSNQDQANQSDVSSNNSGSGNLLSEMQKKTKKGLKVFKKLIDEDKSKKNFFADQGQSPTSSQFEGGGFGDDETPKQKEFKIPDSDKSGGL